MHLYLRVHTHTHTTFYSVSLSLTIFLSDSISVQAFGYVLCMCACVLNASCVFPTRPLCARVFPRIHCVRICSQCGLCVCMCCNTQIKQFVYDYTHCKNVNNSRQTCAEFFTTNSLPFQTCKCKINIELAESLSVSVTTLLSGLFRLSLINPVADQRSHRQLLLQPAVELCIRFRFHAVVPAQSHFRCMI